jgi:hypothetical protein
LKLWASGRYGFSLPKKVEITTGAGETSVFIYYNRRLGFRSELTNRALIRIAIAQFLESDGAAAGVVEVNDAVPPFAGTLTPIRPASLPAPPRLRPGRSRAARMRSE